MPLILVEDKKKKKVKEKNVKKKNGRRESREQELKEKMLQKQERIERFKGQMITNKKCYPGKPPEQ